MSAVLKPNLEPWVKFPDRSTIVRSNQLPWTPWAMPGTRFKLLYINRAVQLTVVLLDVAPNTEASVHKHFGDAHAYVLKGGFGYEHGEVFEGDYMVEAGGVTHTPKTGDTGVLMLGVMFGGIGGFGPDGQLAGVLDCDWHYETAKANGAAAHLDDA